MMKYCNSVREIMTKHAKTLKVEMYLIHFADVTILAPVTFHSLIVLTINNLLRSISHYRVCFGYI